MREQKKYPSACTYRISRNDKLKLGKFNKTTGIGFLSESEYLGKSSPAPGQYKINETLVNGIIDYSDIKDTKDHSKIPGFRIIRPKTKENWRPVKNSQPSPASYNPEYNKKSLLKKVTNALFSKQERMIKIKNKQIPGVGTYKLDQVMDKIYKPMRSARR